MRFSLEIAAAAAANLDLHLHQRSILTLPPEFFFWVRVETILQAAWGIGAIPPPYLVIAGVARASRAPAVFVWRASATGRGSRAAVERRRTWRGHQ